MDNSRIDKKRIKGKRLKRIFFFFLTVFLVICAYGGYLFYETFRAANEAYTELERDKSKYRESDIEINEDPFSVLIMGIEDYSSGGANGRTDALILATLNPSEQTMKLVSIPRDTRVYYEHLGNYSKINHAHAYDGKEMTIEKVEELLEVPIDYYTAINFDGFKNVIDLLGGITVEVPFDFSEKSDVDNSRIYFQAGEMKLNGEEALAYARMRKQDRLGDYGRNERQRQIIESAVDELISPQNLFKIDKIAREMGRNVETNIRVSEGIGLTKQYSNLNSSKIESIRLEGEDERINNISYFIPSDEGILEVQSKLKQHLELEDAAPIDQE